MIDPEAKVLAHVGRLVDWQRGLRPGPVTIEWDLSNRCTLGCDGCHFAHTHSRGPLAARPKPEWMASGTGDLADTQLVLRGLEEAAALGVQGIVWSGGGEPTTHYDWRSFFVCANEHGLEQGLYTHGALLRSEDQEALSRLSFAVVSLDCADAASYQAYKGVDAFERACQGLTLLVQAGVTTGASFLLHEGNLEHAYPMLSLARELGASYTTFRPLIETSARDPRILAGRSEHRQWITQRARQLLELSLEPDVVLDPDRFWLLRDWKPEARGYATCKGIQLTTLISPDGTVWICPNHRGITALGSLAHESLADIWARHPGVVTDFAKCRALCRLHLTNLAIANLEKPREHTAFV